MPRHWPKDDHMTDNSIFPNKNVEMGKFESVLFRMMRPRFGVGPGVLYCRIYRETRVPQP